MIGFEAAQESGSGRTGQTRLGRFFVSSFVPKFAFAATTKKWFVCRSPFFGNGRVPAICLHYSLLSKKTLIKTPLWKDGSEVKIQSPATLH